MSLYLLAAGLDLSVAMLTLYDSSSTGSRIVMFLSRSRDESRS